MNYKSVVLGGILDNFEPSILTLISALSACGQMSNRIIRENHAGHVDPASAVTSSGRVGIPHRVREDLYVLQAENICKREGDIVEVIHRDNEGWWVLILDGKR